MANINLRGLLGFFVYLVFAACIAPVHSYPTTLSNTTQILEKRVPIPAIPTAAEAFDRLIPLGPGKQVFYGGGTLEAASHYARSIGGGLMANADNGEGWATLEGGPFEERIKRYLEDEPTWTDEELDQAVQAVSNAYAMHAEGDVVVVLAYDMPLPKDRVGSNYEKSYWYGEFETMVKKGKVDKILAFDMKNPSAEPQGQPREYWPEPESKTQHAG